MKKDQKIIEYLRHMLQTNDNYAKRALVIVYNNQTSNEKSSLATLNMNGVGFTKADGHKLAGIAKFYISKNYLSDKQLSYVKKRIYKYWKQILAVADISKLQQLSESSQGE